MERVTIFTFERQSLEDEVRTRGNGGSMKKEITSFSEYFRNFLRERHTDREGVCSLDIPGTATTYLGIFFSTIISEWSMEGETLSIDTAGGTERKPLDEFFDRYLERHSIVGLTAVKVRLDRSPEECEALGRRVASILAGWIEEVDRQRERLRSEFPFLYSRANTGAIHRPRILDGLLSAFVADYRLSIEDGVTLGLPFEFFDELGWRCIAGLAGWVDGRGLLGQLRASHEPIATPRQFQELGASFMKVIVAWIEGLNLLGPQENKRPASRLRWNRRRRNFGFRRRP